MSNVMSKRQRISSRENRASAKYYGVQKCRVVIDYEQHESETMENSAWFRELTCLIEKRKGSLAEVTAKRAYGVGAPALSEAPSVVDETDDEVPTECDDCFPMTKCACDAK